MNLHNSIGIYIIYILLYLPDMCLQLEVFVVLFLGGSETFKDKQYFFYQEVRSHHSKRPHSKTTLRINRANLLESVSLFLLSLLKTVKTLPLLYVCSLLQDV